MHQEFFITGFTAIFIFAHTHTQTHTLIYIYIYIESYQRLKKWYLIPPCLTLSIIRYVSRVKWVNPGKGVVPSPTPWSNSYQKGRLQDPINYGRQLYNIYIYFFFFFIIQCVKAHLIPCPHQLPTRCGNTVSVAQGGTATPGATKQLLPPDRVLRELYIYIYIYIYTRSIKSRDYIGC